GHIACDGMYIIEDQSGREARKLDQLSLQCDHNGKKDDRRCAKGKAVPKASHSIPRDDDEIEACQHDGREHIEQPVACQRPEGGRSIAPCDGFIHRTEDNKIKRIPPLARGWHHPRRPKQQRRRRPDGEMTKIPAVLKYAGCTIRHCGEVSLSVLRQEYNRYPFFFPEYFRALVHGLPFVERPFGFVVRATLSSTADWRAIGSSAMASSVASRRLISSRRRAAVSNSRSAAASFMRFSRSAICVRRLWPMKLSFASPVSTRTWSRS